MSGIDNDNQGNVSVTLFICDHASPKNCETISATSTDNYIGELLQIPSPITQDIKIRNELHFYFR